MPNAQSWGEKAYKQFTEARLSENAMETFFDQLPRLNLQTFSSITQSKTVKVSGNGSDCSDKTTEYEKVFTVFTITLSMGFSNRRVLPKKANKTALANEIDKQAIATTCIPRPVTAFNLDAMVIIQKHNGNQKTFAELANTLFQKFKAKASECTGSDAVFDVYGDESIKDAERSNRCC